MQLSRRNFLGGAGAFGALALTGCQCPFCTCSKPRVAVQLYSLGGYIRGVKDKNGNVIKEGVGLAQTFKELKAMGYAGVEFAGYGDKGGKSLDAKTIKAMLDDNGLEACGTHVSCKDFAPDTIKATCEFNLAYGNKFICSPGGGNFPAKGEKLDDFLPKLCEFYNQAAETAKSYGCLIGLHNHTGEFNLKMADGTTYWDYFFSHTNHDVQMEQDVGWTTCAGFDPCEQFKKYPHRSYTIHAKENGMGKGVTKFDAILGQPGQPGAKGVEWDRVIAATIEDGVQWYVVECERHFDSLDAVRPSREFLFSKGL